jgi:hypothetical protein
MPTLSPDFSLVAESLSRLITDAGIQRKLKGIQISPNYSLSHLLFVDDILIFCNGRLSFLENLKDILNIFFLATRMKINRDKSSLLVWGLPLQESNTISALLGVQIKDPTEGLRYHGFTLKASDYRKAYWAWLLEKIEKRFTPWYNRWLSRARRLVLLKSVIESILVYWTSLSWVPKGILHKISQKYLHFLWVGKEDSKSLVLASKNHISKPKGNGGWGLKNIFTFAKSLATKNSWSLIEGNGLWHIIIKEKYFPHQSILEWIRTPNKSTNKGTIIWKSIINSFTQ